MTTTVHGLAELKALAGTDLGAGGWLEVTQDRIDTFADATGDHQWIHVDVERAAAGPFGGTIAHGYLTLALLIPLWTDLLRIEGIGMAVNYGLNKVRFPAPVPAGAKVRLAARLGAVEDVGPRTVQAVVDLTLELEGSDKPAVVAQAVYRYLAPPA
jgi:acyl dehydratase